MSPPTTPCGQTKEPLAVESSSNSTPKFNTPRPTYPALARQAPLRPPGASSSEPPIAALHLRGARYIHGGNYITNSDYERLRCSAHRADIQRLDPYLYEEDGRSVALRNAEPRAPAPGGSRSRSRSVSPSPSRPNSPSLSNSPSRPNSPSRSTSRSRSRSRSRSHSRSSIPNMNSPHTPNNRKVPDNSKRSNIMAGGHFDASGLTPDVPAPPPKDTPRPKRVSPLDKDLPPKPPLRRAFSPQRRGILDATDSAAKRMTDSYPPLKPSNVAGLRHSLSDSSFKTTLSLRSYLISDQREFGTASTKTAQKVRGLPITIASQRTLQQASSQQTIYEALGTHPLDGSRKPVSTSAHRAFSHSQSGHIGTYRNGSPIQRYPATSKKAVAKTPVKFNRRKNRDFQLLGDTASDDEIDIKVALKQTVGISKSDKKNIGIYGDTLAEDSGEDSPAPSDGGRRYGQLGVGPSVRYSKDAHDLLMGKSPKNSKKIFKSNSRVPSGKVLNEGPSTRIPLPKKIAREVKSRFSVGDRPASRLTRPTASSAARTQESKSRVESRKSSNTPPEMKKVSEVKKGSQGLRSRVSDLLHGRRRSAPPVAKSPAPLVHKKKYDVRRMSRMTATEVIISDEQAQKRASAPGHLEDIQEAVKAHSSANVPRRLIPNRALPVRVNSNNAALPGRNNSTNAGLPARINSINAGLPARINSINAGLPARNNSINAGLPARNNSINAGLPARINSNNAGLPARNNSINAGLPARINSINANQRSNSLESIRAHYIQDAAALQTEDARLETAISGVQASLDEIIALTQNVEYPGFRNVTEPIIHSLAASIISAQNARAAVVGLGNASQRVMTDALVMSEAINRAAVAAQKMVGDIRGMVPEAPPAENGLPRAEL